MPFPSPGDLPGRGDQTPVSCISWWILYPWATWEAQFSICIGALEFLQHGITNYRLYSSSNVFLRGSGGRKAEAGVAAELGLSRGPCCSPSLWCFLPFRYTPPIPAFLVTQSFLGWAFLSMSSCSTLDIFKTQDPERPFPGPVLSPSRPGQCPEAWARSPLSLHSGVDAVSPPEVGAPKAGSRVVRSRGGADGPSCRDHTHVSPPSSEVY